MSDIAISVENISKHYRIGAVGGPSYHRLSEMISGVPRALWNYGRIAFKPSKDNTGAGESANKDEFWALKDVSFEVKQGEVVGIIGRNGAGKSTLLKILSRITEPTSGRFGIRGRVASLLEVGTGFHPELTGRENIYVSGVTLGMTRAEIKKRFDEIVDFSGVEKFLDTPVKHYSSGMQVRLGFAVAAHLESEILIIDEVLAVGDYSFRSKCIQRVSELSQSGSACILVSHSLKDIKRLCKSAIMLKDGRAIAGSSVDGVVNQYLWETETSTSLSGGVIDSVFVRNALGNNLMISSGDSINVTLQATPSFAFKSPRVAFCVDSDSGIRLLHLDSTLICDHFSLRPNVPNTIQFHIPRLPLAPGSYFGTVWLSDGHEIVDWHKQAITFQVVHHPLPGTLRPLEPGQALVQCPYSITVNSIEL